MEEKRVGIITASVGGLYTVRCKTDGGYEDVKCRARGVFRHDRITLLVGDRVEIIHDAEEKGIVIDKMFDRKNSLIRPPIANVDTVFVTMASASPTPMLDMTDKLISILEYNSIEPIIIVGKCELSREESQRICEVYKKGGFRVFEVSCATGEGIDELKGFISENLGEKVFAFAGASGVGKSTLINKLFPSLALETGEVSRKTERGRHTTRSVNLLDVGDGGYIADTPGFSMLDFERFDFFELEDLAMTFREFGERIGECRYKKCTHTKEEGCAIIEAIGRGEIAKSRHESYNQLYAVLKAKNKWDK